MTVLSAQSIRRVQPISPLLPRTQHAESGCSFGLSACGYDIRIKQGFVLQPGEFVLASTIEKFSMPDNLVGIVHDKSTWARRGIAVQNTCIEPGWRGYLTLEITNHGKEIIEIASGSPIAQVLFHKLDAPTDMVYDGKYQDQPDRPVEAKSGIGHK